MLELQQRSTEGSSLIGTRNFWTHLSPS
jgi:hypothetical protein